MENVFMIVGFLLAAYSVVANDAIQTLGTFLSSNRDKKWYVLWGFIGSILVAVLFYGWFVNNGDLSYGRLSGIDLPQPFSWWYIIPPIVLLIITRYGIPISTTFLILSVFTLAKFGEDKTTMDLLASMFDFDQKIGKMLGKSLTGYGLAMVVGLIVYLITTKSLEKKFVNSENDNRKLWTIFQWCSTGLLWAYWLTQDLANVYVYLPRDLGFGEVLLSLLFFLLLLGYVFYNNGGGIQKIVTSKTNTKDIRSATIIDFIFAILLGFFKEVNDIPMSTTWVFVGLLAGREIAMNAMMEGKVNRNTLKMLASDLLKVIAGLVVSLLLVVLIYALFK